MSKHTQGELVVSLEAINYTREIEIVGGRDRVAIIRTHEYKDKGNALANAQRIVKTWNSHDELLNSLQGVNDLLTKQYAIKDELLEALKEICDNPSGLCSLPLGVEARARRAINKAEGGTNEKDR